MLKQKKAKARSSLSLIPLRFSAALLRCPPSECDVFLEAHEPLRTGSCVSPFPSQSDIHTYANNKNGEPALAVATQTAGPQASQARSRNARGRARLGGFMLSGFDVFAIVL